MHSDISDMCHAGWVCDGAQHLQSPWASGGSRVSMFGSHGNTMAVLSGAKKPQGVQLAGFLTEDGQLFPPGCGRSRAPTRGGGSAAKLASVASSAMATANTLAGVMSEHIALQRDQLRVQDRHCKCSRPLFQMPLCSDMQEQWSWSNAPRQSLQAMHWPPWHPFNFLCAPTCRARDPALPGHRRLRRTCLVFVVIGLCVPHAGVLVGPGMDLPQEAAARMRPAVRQTSFAVAHHTCMHPGYKPIWAQQGRGAASNGLYLDNSKVYQLINSGAPKTRGFINR